MSALENVCVELARSVARKNRVPISEDRPEEAPEAFTCACMPVLVATRGRSLLVSEIRMKQRGRNE